MNDEMHPGHAPPLGWHRGSTPGMVLTQWQASGCVSQANLLRWLSQSSGTAAADPDSDSDWRRSSGSGVRVAMAAACSALTARASARSQVPVMVEPAGRVQQPARLGVRSAS